MASRIGGPPVGLEDHRQLALDLGYGEAAELEPLDAGQDGRADLGRVGGAEDEDDVRGRFLERLEQDVPALVDPLDLVDDEDLPLHVRRRRPGPLDELPDLVDLVVRGGIELDDVEGPALADGDARRTDVARFAVLEVGAVERLGDDPRHRRLAGAARSDEQQRMGDLAGPDGVPQRRDDGILADDPAERLGTPATVERKVRPALGRAVRGQSRFHATLRPERLNAVHPPSIGRSRAHESRAARTRPFRGTRRRSLSAASFRT